MTTPEQITALLVGKTQTGRADQQGHRTIAQAGASQQTPSL